MRSDDPRLAHVIERFELDGQCVIVPALDAWDALLEDGALDGRPLGVGRLAAQYVALARTTTGLFVGLGEDRVADKPWWVFHVVRLSDDGVGFARVQVERQCCTSCGWAGATGNPRVLALYLGTADALAAMARWSAAPSVRCPACGGPFPHPALWSARP